MVALLVRGGGVGEAWVRAPGSIAPRAWVLGVVAVQVRAEDGSVRARLRRHATGWREAELAPLAAPSLVHVTLAEGAIPAAPTVAVAALRADECASFELFIDGASVARAGLARERLRQHPAPRAFGHVFCRWLAAGAPELGCDLTEFLSLPEGVKFERLVVPRLAVGQTASYALAVAA